MIIAIYLLSIVLTLECVSSQQCGCNPRARRDAENGLFHNITEGGMALIEGDIVFKARDAFLYSGFRAAENGRVRWPRGEVFYEASRMNGQDQQSIRQALGALSKATQNCVSFIEIQGGRLPQNYVSVFPGGGCYSSIGRQSGRQELSLGQGCIWDFTIQHEFLHALGFYHEQSRPDRDQFIRVNWNYIDSNMCHNFQRCVGCTVTTPYDIKSIMQYVGEAFSCRQGTPTMTGSSGQQIGWNTQLTQYDVKKIKDYYQCSNGPSPVV